MRVHLAVAIDYDRGAVLAADVEQALGEGLAWPRRPGEQDPVPMRTVEFTAVIVSERLHERLLETGQQVVFPQATAGDSEIVHVALADAGRRDAIDDEIDAMNLPALTALDKAWSEYWHAAVSGSMSTDRKREALRALREEMGLR